MKILTIFSLAILVLAGCRSYSWRSQVPAAYRSVSVPTFRNETLVPTAGSVLTRQVLREFQREGTFKLAGSDAPVEVQGTLTAAEYHGESDSRRIHYSRLDAASASLVAKISVIDRAQGKVLVDNRVYRAESPYVDGSNMTAARNLAIERAADELARAIVDDLTLFNWEEKTK